MNYNQATEGKAVYDGVLATVCCLCVACGGGKAGGGHVDEHGLQIVSEHNVGAASKTISDRDAAVAAEVAAMGLPTAVSQPVGLPTAFAQPMP